MNFVKDYFEKLKIGLDKFDFSKIERVVDILLNAWKNNQHVFIIGNGGSAAIASHLACDLGKGTLKRMYDPSEKRFKVISLTDNTPLLTALANDVTYENVFAQQLNNLIERGDILIAITGSGNSENILKAIKVAQEKKAIIIGFLGSDGGKAKEMVDYSIVYEDIHYGRIEDSHSILSHVITCWLREKMNDLKGSGSFFKEETGKTGISKKKIMITGGAGFIGSNLAKELVKDGHKVIIVDDFSYGSMLNIMQNGIPIAEIHKISISDDKLFDLMKGVDYVYHFAAISCLPVCLSQPSYSTKVNVAGTLNVLEAARINNVKRVIFASSSAVYENNKTFPLKEEEEVNPHAIYSVQKHSGEEFCKAYRKLYDMDIVITRYFNIYGPNQDYTRQKPPVMSYIIKELIQNKIPIMYGTGEQKRDFLFIDDVTAINKLFMEKEEAKNETFNVGSGKIYSINEIYEIIEGVLKTGIKPLRKSANEMYEGIDKIKEGKNITDEVIAHETNKFTQADISKAKRVLGWEPRVDLKEGILASVEFIKKMIKIEKDSNQKISIKQAVILCGGLGERLRPITDIIPKPMVEVNGKPFLEHLITQIKEQGISEVVLCTGYKKEIIEDYFKDGSKFGVKIKYSRGLTEWEQAKRLWEARELIDDYFLLLYADNYVPSFDLRKSLEFYTTKKKILSFIIFSKPEKNNLKLDENNLITIYDKTRTAEGLKYVELGYMLVDKKRVFEFIDNSNISFQETIKKLVEKREIAGLETKYKYQSISDIDRLKKTGEYFSPKKILLIDRDGTINKKPPRGEYVLKKEDFEFIEDSIIALKQLSDRGFKFIIITNQPAISKGLITKEDAERLNEFMMDRLRAEGINFLDFFYCPHDVNEGCYCRKPNPGMIIDACNKYFINPKDTYFIGDDERDCLAAVRAGCGSILIGKDYDLSLNIKYHNIYVNPDYSSKNLSDILECIIKKF